MKTKQKTAHENPLLDQLREIRANVNHDIQDMTLEQLQRYLKEKKTLHPKAVWG